MSAWGVFSGGCVLETEPHPPRIMFMGNSITLNAPRPEVGWTHDWGMAASARDKDYVHETLRLLAEKGLPLEGRIASRPCPECDGAIDEQIHNMDEVRALAPRFVVVQLAEHSGDIELKSGKMTSQYRELLQGLRDAGVPHVYCLGSWGETEKDGPHAVAIYLAAKDFSEVRYVDIRDVAADPAASGDTTLFQDPFVRWHPGDAGMLGMASRLADAIWRDR